MNHIDARIEQLLATGDRILDLLEQGKLKDVKRLLRLINKIHERVKSLIAQARQELEQ